MKFFNRSTDFFLSLFDQNQIDFKSFHDDSLVVVGHTFVEVTGGNLLFKDPIFSSAQLQNNFTVFRLFRRKEPIALGYDVWSVYIL